MKEHRINVRATATDVKELRKVAKKIGLPSSYIVREAVREKIETLRRTHPRLQPAEQTALETSN
jgi:hypothetical protein